MEKRMTQKTLARELGISLKTVQRALARSPQVSETTRRRIIDHAASCGYFVHRGARGLSRKNSRSIVIFSSCTPDYFWDRVARGIDLARQQISFLGYSARYQPVPPRDTAAYLQLLQEALDGGMEAAGIVNNPEYDMSRIFRFLTANNIPHITISVDAPETGRLCTVSPDYGEGGRLAAEFLGKTAGAQGSKKGNILIIHNPVNSEHVLAGAHVNEERLLQFVHYLSIHFPGVDHQVVSFRKRRHDDNLKDEIEQVILDPQADFTGIYSIAEVQDTLAEVILRHGLEGRHNIIVHGITPNTERYLKSHALTAAINQNPMLQGYYAVRILEYYLETGTVPDDIPAVAHSIVMGSNLRNEENFRFFSTLFEQKNSPPR